MNKIKPVRFYSLYRNFLIVIFFRLHEISVNLINFSKFILVISLIFLFHYLLYLMRLRVTEKVLWLPLFSSNCFSLQQIWTDRCKLLVKVSTFVKLDKGGLIQTHWITLFGRHLLQFEISCVKTWHAMCFRENNNGGIKPAYKWACECYQCFSWCKLNLIHGDQHTPRYRDYSQILFGKLLRWNNCYVMLKK